MQILSTLRATRFIRALTLMPQAKQCVINIIIIKITISDSWDIYQGLQPLFMESWELRPPLAWLETFSSWIFHQLTSMWSSFNNMLWNAGHSCHLQSVAPWACSRCKPVQEDKVPVTFRIAFRFWLECTSHVL